MDGNVIVLILAGCCLFSCCVGLFVRYYFGPDAVKTILNRDLIKDAMKDFKFDTSSGLPNIRPRFSTIRPQGFKKRINFSVPDDANIGEPQSKTDVECSALCFDSEGCFGFTMENGKCQLKGNVTFINYEKGKEIRVSSDAGGTKFGVLPFALSNTLTPNLWSNSSMTLGDAVENCWSTPECTGFTYINGVATMYGEAFVLDSGKPGSNTYVKFDWMDKSGIGQKGAKYTDAASQGGFHIDDMFFKINNSFTEPPAPSPGLRPYQYYARDMNYFRLWNGGNWNAGVDAKKNPPQKVDKVNSLEHCANLCMSNTSCQSFMWKRDAKECYFRRDLTRDNNTRYYCRSEPLINDSVNKCRGGEEPADFISGGAVCKTANGEYKAVAQCWEDAGSWAEPGTDSYYKLQDPMEQTCPEACGPNQLCQVSMWTRNDCSIFEFEPSVKETNNDFSTQWKFDYFPG